MTKQIEEAVESVRLKFSSSNGVPVERATITKEEYEAIKTQAVEQERERIAREVEGLSAYYCDNGDKGYIYGVEIKEVLAIIKGGEA